MVDRADTEASEFECPVLILMRREEARQGPWRFPRWTLQGVLMGDADAGPIARRQIRAEEDCVDYLWTGFRMPLHRDAAESYWFNLTSTQPSLYVLCRPGQDIDLEPCMVTADHDEAGAMMEADEQVFSAPIPAAIVSRLERFIMHYYRPGPRKKRKRDDWAQETGNGHEG